MISLPTLRFLPPEWLLRDGEGGLEVQSVVSSRVVRFEGVLREAVLRGSAGESPALRAMASMDPTVASILDALRAGTPGAWNRAALLRGSGYGQLFLELTARCNEQCTHCYAESSPEREEELPLETALAVLDDAKELGFQRVQLTGGDPLIARHVLTIAEHVHELGFALEIYTNGLALVGDTFSRLRDFGASFAFSFYSQDPAVHDRMTRTPGSQVRTLRAIERARAAGLSTRVGVIISEVNRDGAEATVAFLRGLGFTSDTLGIDAARGVGRGVHSSELEAIRRTLAETEGNRGGHRVDASGARLAGTACVAPDGAVYPCIFSRHLPLGNVLRQRLTEVLGADAPVRGPEAADETRAWSDRLTCFNCQLRSAFLVDPQAPRRPGALHVLQGASL